MPDEPELDPLQHADILAVIKLRDDLEESGRFNQRVAEATEQALGRVARELYPGMNHYWQPEQLRGLQKEISFLASLYWEELAKLERQAQESLSEPEGK